MSEFAKETTLISVEDELKKSYLDYSMSVIVGRALPDVRDGLKPVHRRVLYAMSVLKNDWNKAYKKSARVVGDVIGKYHPHSDTAIYDTLVRMAQPFSLRYLLVDGQGNFGSVDGDTPASMRYTEVRMTKLAHTLLGDLDKDTVDFVPNYDATETMPNVLPSLFPNLLVNGSAGIAVGMATNMPPHNLCEVIDACVAKIDQPDIDLPGIMQHIKGPDFPTAAFINGMSGIMQAYQTGRGRIYLRARTFIEEDKKSKRQSIVVSELPYQINKALLIEKIAELVKEGKIEGISAIRDESDKDGMRMVIEVKRSESADVILNNLYKQTRMQTVYGINMVALDATGMPRLFPLMDLLDAFLQHRREIVTRRSLYLLRKARQRAHILEGLAIALSHIDEMIALIKKAQHPKEAREALLARPWSARLVQEMFGARHITSRPQHLPEAFGLHGDDYHLSPDQAQAILELRLHRLTGLERDKIFSEYKTLLDEIEALLDILSDPDQLMQVIREELLQVKQDFGDARRTEILQDMYNVTNEDLIPRQDWVITLSAKGYVKSQLLGTYQAQRRGGRGKIATGVKEEDFVKQLVVSCSHDTILCFSNLGRVYWLKAYNIMPSTRTTRGKPIVNLLPLSEGERITTILPICDFGTPSPSGEATETSETNDTDALPAEEDADGSVSGPFVFMVTMRGVAKRVKLSAFSRPRQGGIIAVHLKEGDQLVSVALTDGARDIMLFSSAGKVIRFDESQVRSMGRTATGVRGMLLKEGQHIVALLIAKPKIDILTATANGFGKRTALRAFRQTSRGGQGIIAMQISKRNGPVIDAVAVTSEDELLLISDGGTLVRTRVSEISRIGRNTQGVRLINLSKQEKLIGVERTDALDHLEPEPSSTG